MISVNPRESEILGEKSVAALACVPVGVDIVNVFRAPDALPGIAGEAVAIGAKTCGVSSRLTVLGVQMPMHADAVGVPDPETPVGARGVGEPPVGARGVGEPPVGAAYGAVMNAIASAVGVDAFRRAPVTADVVLMTLEHGKRMHEPLQAHW